MSRPTRDHLIVCPGCDRHRRASDERCPHCGSVALPAATHHNEIPPNIQVMYGPPPFLLFGVPLPRRLFAVALLALFTATLLALWWYAQ
jgi:hypothetical protein